MILTGGPLDRRKHFRLKASKDINVIVGPQTALVPGFLADISRGGVSIEYIPIWSTLKTDRVVDIVFEGEKIGIEKLSGKTIFDIEIEEEYYTPVIFRKLGVAFQQLTSKQSVELENCIKTLQASFP